MSDDKYVLGHEMLRECWIDWSAGCGIGRKTAYEEFDRWLADHDANVSAAECNSGDLEELELIVMGFFKKHGENWADYDLALYLASHGVAVMR